MTSPACHVCGSQALFLMKKDGFEEYECSTCLLSFVHPQPEADWLKDNLYSFESGYQGNKKTDLSLNKVEGRIGEVVEYLAQRKPEGRLLDVGCSSGQFLYSANKRGIRGVGIEINKRTADIARANGFEVFGGFIEDAPFEKESFDIIYLGDVIEHVTDPRSLMRTCQGLLKKDGLLVIATPNMDCFWSKASLAFYKVMGVPWAAATPPHHLFQFNLNNLNLLLKEQYFIPIKSIFFRISSLKYELGSLHLYKKFKENKGIGNLAFMVFAFALYTGLYSLNFLLSSFLPKDFHMIVFYQRNNLE